MAHSCRWRFPARPGGISSSSGGGVGVAGGGRRAGRIRVTASLLRSGTEANADGLGPGFDAALQVSAAIGGNLRKFRDVFGEASGSSSGEEESFCGFGMHNENRRIQSSTRTSSAKLSQDKKPRGRPPRIPSAQTLPLLPSFAPHGVPEGTERLQDKVRRPPGRPPGTGEKRRGRPPSGGQRCWQQRTQEDGKEETPLEERSKKTVRRMPLASVHQELVKLPRGPKVGCITKITKMKRLRTVKLSPLKSRLKGVGRKGVPVPVVPRRRRGRPPSAERLKAEAAAVAAAIAQASSSPIPQSSIMEAEFGKQKVRRERNMAPDTSQHRQRVSHIGDGSLGSGPPGSPSHLPLDTSTRPGRQAAVRQSPRRLKPVRIVPPSKRTDTTIAKQLLQRAKKGAQKKKLLEKDVSVITGPATVGMEAGIRRRRKTQLKNIRQFIMPVVSTVSLRIIKTPKRFIEDESSFSTPPPHLKMPRVDPSPATTVQQSSSLSVPAATTVPGSTVSAGAGSVSSTCGPPPPPPPAPNMTAGSCNNSTSNGRFSSSAASCGSSAVSQHSSQMSSGESSRSSSPSLDSSSDSQASEGTQAPSEEPDRSPSSQGERENSLLHESQPPSPPSEPEHVTLMERNRRGQQRGLSVGRGALGTSRQASLATSRKKSIISPAKGVLISSSSRVASKQASSTASSSSSPPPPPLLAPPQPSPSTASAISEHHPHSPWIMPHPITPFIPSPVLSSLQEKRHSILREPTFRWTSRSEHHYFSSAKYAKEGLIRKPIFDNFRPPPLTAEDVGLLPGSGGGSVGVTGNFPGQGGSPGSGSRLFSQLHHQHSSSRFETPGNKRSPLLRAPQFTPSEAHSRIFESVTLPSSSASSAGSVSSIATRTLRRRRRRVYGPLRSQARSPSHSMTTRSGQSCRTSSELSPLPGHNSTNATGGSGSLPVVAASTLATSALTPASFSTFSSGCLSLPMEDAVDTYQPGCRKSARGLGVVRDSSTSSSPLFPLFPSSPQTAAKGVRDRGTSVSQETVVMEKERESERMKGREKENKKDIHREQEKRGKAPTAEGISCTTFSVFPLDGDESITHKKHPGRKKCHFTDANIGTSPSSTLQPAVTSLLSKGRISKKGRPTEAESRVKEKERDMERVGALLPQSTQAGATRKQTTIALLGTVQAEEQQVAELLKKAKAQLHKIEKSKSLKMSELPKAQGQESDSSETSARGPRIKHVCRRAAVALGRNRAVFPDDMPTLSALPWEEREKILSSMGNDDKSSVAGSEEAEPQAPPIKPIRPVTRHKTLQEPPARKGRRSRRCGQCSGCQVPDDCGVCTNCLDKPKFGGRNIKKQCCKVRKCQNLQWMPSKAFLQKQAKARKDRKKRHLAENKESHLSTKSHCSENDQKTGPSIMREESFRKKCETPPPPKHNEEKRKPQCPSPLSPPQRDTPPALNAAPIQEGCPPAKQVAAPPNVNGKRERKVQLLSPSPTSVQGTAGQNSVSEGPTQGLQCQQEQVMAKKEDGIKARLSDPRKKPPQKFSVTPDPETATEATKQMKTVEKPRCAIFPKQKLKDKERIPLPRLESALSVGGRAKQKQGPCDGVHRLRVDFKEDCDVDNVWDMGGLSLLTSIPINPRVVCFLCASSGHVEFVYCQVCCEPFHLFCLEESDRPLQEQLENWCCRRCRFCHTCGHQHQNAKVGEMTLLKLLECNKCRNSYHPECLGPNHPTRPSKKKKVWICPKCVRCKSCGATSPGKGWGAQWSHDFTLCHDCAKLFAKGNFCPLCNKCYDDDDYESKMMQCGKCDRWVHARCEDLTDEKYEILSSLPESVVYTCTSCTEQQPAEWRTALEKELQGSVRRVLTALLNSRTSTHLLRYRQAVMKPPELNPETEESLPSRRSPEGPDPPVLTEMVPSKDGPLDLESVKRKMEIGQYKAVLDFSDDVVRIIQTSINFDGGQPESKKANSMVKSFFIRQMERVFPWFKVKESRFWEPNKVSSNSGLLPNAVLPPSLDHNYAQWRDEMARAELPMHMKNIIPAPQSKGPGDPDSLIPPSSAPTPPVVHGPDLSQEDSPELSPPPDVNDNRQCALCLKYGDDNTNDRGRLLYIGQNEWTHVNCALWSAEVFEDDDGSLKNVHMAVIRGKQLRCEHCLRPGATVGCCLTSCTSNFHFMCARRCHCVFLEDKKVYCQCHRDLIKGEVVSESGFEVTRRVLVDFEGINLRRKFLNGLEPENVHLMIGSMTVDCLGILTELSDCEHKLFPIGYQCSRVYWSTLDARKRCVYTCRIVICHPPVMEPDVSSNVEHEENHTIAHSPPVSDVEMLPATSKMDGSPSLTENQLLPTQSELKPVARNRCPSYPPCQRSPSSRPLPSPGGPSRSVHEIVTVGDPLLSNSLRSIGSRRHSTSSLSPLSYKQRMPSPARAISKLCRTGSFSSAPSLCSVVGDLDKETEKNRPLRPLPDGSQRHETRILSPVSQRRHKFNVPDKSPDSNEVDGKQTADEKSLLNKASPAVSRVSLALVASAGIARNHKNSGDIYKVEKVKRNDKDPEILTGHNFSSKHPLSITKESHGNDPSKDINISLPTASKDFVCPGPLRPRKDIGRKPCGNVSAPAAPIKVLWSSGADTTGENIMRRGLQATPLSVTSTGALSTKDARSKGRTCNSRENEKEWKSQSTLHAIVPGFGVKSHAIEKIAKHKAEERGFKVKENFVSPDKAISCTQPKLSTDKGVKAFQISNETVVTDGSQKDKKHTVKVVHNALKGDPNGTDSTFSDKATTTSLSPTSQSSYRRSLRSLVFSPCASSESSEADAQHNPDDSEESILKHSCIREEAETTVEGEGCSLDDSVRIDKHLEEESSGSNKRRYPRRSARARSNMFFGLTPFYGVRSYGEEDIPFYNSGESSGKRRVGGGGSKRSAEGQVDGADDMSSSSEDSSDEHLSAISQCTEEDSYYYNFTRTIINPRSGISSAGGIEQCLANGSQLQRFLNNDVGEEMIVETGLERTRGLGRPRIGQLDGIDDSSESDASTSATTTTITATTSSSNKSKRKGRENKTEKLNVESEKDVQNSSGAIVGSNRNNNREGRKHLKENCLPLGGMKSQGQDHLDSQLSLNTELLKSDSDNTNSDDCGNILPSDIMEFVLNTPSMHGLGQQQEASSSELLSLDESFELAGNRGKDIGLFEEFSQQLPSSEQVEGSVNASIPGEEPYGLPLELPSDLSVLTTRSPSIANQNHGTLIPESSEHAILSLSSGETTAEKGGDQQRGGSSSSNKNKKTVTGDLQVTKGHITPEHFIATQVEGERLASPSISPVVEHGTQDLTRTSATPGMPSSPALPLQGQKYMGVSAESPNPAQVATTTVQTASTHLKPGTEKLIVLNQHLQPLYVVQTLPNGVTQKIQIGPSVTTTGVIDTSSVTGSLTLAPNLGAGIQTSQSLFSHSAKSLVTMSHHPQIQAYTGQAGFQTGMPNTTSGLLIGIHPQDPQAALSEAGHHSTTIVSSSSSITPAAGHGKKRPISRVQSRKTKRLARAGNHSTLSPSDGGTNMTLINFSPSQIPATVPAQTLGTLTSTAAASHRKMPNIIKRPKVGVCFEPSPLQNLSTQNVPAGILKHETQSQLVPCTVSGINPNQSVLNVVSVPAGGTHGLLGSTDISNLFIKANTQKISLPEQQMVLQSSSPRISPLSSSIQPPNTNNICVLPPQQTISMPANPRTDHTSNFHLQNHPNQVTSLDKTQTLSHSISTSTSVLQSSRTTPISIASQKRLQQPHKTNNAPTVPATLAKVKQKVKRSQHSPDKTSVKKPKPGIVNTFQERAGRVLLSESMESGNAQERNATKCVVSSVKPDMVSQTSHINEVHPRNAGSSPRCPMEARKLGNRQVANLTREFCRETILESKPKKGLMFEIFSDDGFQIRCNTIEEAWKSLTDKVQEARSNARLKELSFEGVNGLRMLGVLHNAVLFLIEQLYGARHCSRYRFRFHKPEEADEPPLNPHGAARAEFHHRRSVFDVFNFLASKHRLAPDYNPHDDDEEEIQLKSARRATSMDLPMPMRFRHLKKTSKEAVGVYRSPIHGRGLFCKRNIDVGEMVIEYSGNVIRSVLTDKREKYYDSKGIGCYMFRIDDFEVVDATMHGNAARFINHSCEPNCYSRVINIDGQKHIVIFAMRKIYRGEELTYDYKFPIEDPGNKLPCNCGAKKCRKFLN